MMDDLQTLPPLRREPSATKRTRAAYRAKGQCWYCPRMALAGRTMCGDHIRKRREQERRRRERRREERERKEQDQ